MLVPPLRTKASSLLCVRGCTNVPPGLRKTSRETKNLKTHNSPATEQDLDTEQEKQRFCWAQALWNRNQCWTQEWDLCMMQRSSWGNLVLKMTPVLKMGFSGVQGNLNKWCSLKTTLPCPSSPMSLISVYNFSTSKPCLEYKCERQKFPVSWIHKWTPFTLNYTKEQQWGLPGRIFRPTVKCSGRDPNPREFSSPTPDSWTLPLFASPQKKGLIIIINYIFRARNHSCEAKVLFSFQEFPQAAHPEPPKKDNILSPTWAFDKFRLLQHLLNL